MAIVAVGHRGTNIGVPENSIASHNIAFEMGARGIEFDIQMCATEFVVFHDSKVDNKTSGTGQVKNMTLSELKALKLLYDKKLTIHQIPTLREALENVAGRFMVDLDFKAGPENSADILRRILHETGFDKDVAPLVTIFCRDKDAFEKLKPLNDLYAVRPLYLNKDQAKRMSEQAVKVMGLRQHKLTFKRAKRIRRDHDMYLFSNAMKYNIWGLAREWLSLKARRKKPSDKTLRKIYTKAMKGGSLFIQTDYLNDLVAFLKEHNVYQDYALNRHFQPIDDAVSAPPPAIETDGETGMV